MTLRLAFGAVLSCIAASAGFAQQPAPEPVLRARIEPARVVVGQPATLRIEVLAPNYMTAAPVMPDFQIRNAVTRPLDRSNFSERNGDTTLAGIRFEFAIFPQESGSYSIAGQPVTVSYAYNPPTTRQATLALPAIDFDAFFPDAAAALDPFISAQRLAIEQIVQRPDGELKVGDAVTRQITTTADGTLAMLLPPARTARPQGLAAYPAQPVLQDQPDSQTGGLTAMRTDSVTYMLERPGDYTLPAVEVDWWNVTEQKIERAHADPVTLHVLDNPGMRSTMADGAGTDARWHSLVDLLVGRWPRIVVLLLALCGLAWMAPRALRFLRDMHRRRRQAYLDSEAWSFAQLRRAARGGEAGAFYVALLAWLRRFAPAAPGHTINALKKVANDPDLDREIGLLECRLYGNASQSASWSPGGLMRSITAARRSLMRTTTGHQQAIIPADINPSTTPRPARVNRPVAR